MALDFERPLKEIESRIAELRKLNEKSDADFGTEIAALEKKLRSTSKRVYSKIGPWETVQIARHAERPLLRDYIAGLCSEFLELHGDRCFGDDQGIIGGFATLRQHRVMIIGHQKGRTVEEKIKANFGMASPDGYRKALRLMNLAAKYRIPIVSFIDTPGAYPGLEAEARGQAEAIARNLTEMSKLPVPVIVIVTGEGGSGGAIGIGMGDVVLMLSSAVYSVISPEGCAAILWRDKEKAPEAAAALKITAEDLANLGIIDEIIPEPTGGAHRNAEGTIETVGDAIVRHLQRLRKMSSRRLIDQRYDKYSKIGRFKKK
jgi:acetyl-CoA carboxylase carboxyl transferase subunit alpha